MFAHGVIYRKHEWRKSVNIFADKISKRVIRVLITFPLCLRKVCKILPLNRMMRHIKPRLPVSRKMYDLRGFCLCSCAFHRGRECGGLKVPAFQ